jgi:hypothetical protein
VGDSRGAHAFSIGSGVTHYVQVDVDGANGVLSVRTGSYAGPVVAVHAGASLARFSNTVEAILLASNHHVSIEEIQIARYAP